MIMVWLWYQDDTSLLTSKTFWAAGSVLLVPLIGWHVDNYWGQRTAINQLQLSSELRLASLLSGSQLNSSCFHPPPPHPLAPPHEGGTNNAALKIPWFFKQKAERKIMAVGTIKIQFSQILSVIWNGDLGKIWVLCSAKLLISHDRPDHVKGFKL